MFDINVSEEIKTHCENLLKQHNLIDLKQQINQLQL